MIFKSSIAMLISVILAPELYAFEPYSVLEVRENVENSVITLGNSANVDFFVSEDGTQSGLSHEQIEKILSTGIVHGNYGLKSPTGETLYGFKLVNKSNSNEFYFCDTQFRPVDSLLIYFTNATGQLEEANFENRSFDGVIHPIAKIHVDPQRTTKVFLLVKDRSFAPFSLAITTKPALLEHQFRTMYYGGALGIVILMTIGLCIYTAMTVRSQVSLLLVLRALVTMIIPIVLTVVAMKHEPWNLSFSVSQFMLFGDVAGAACLLALIGALFAKNEFIVDAKRSIAITLLATSLIFALLAGLTSLTVMDLLPIANCILNIFAISVLVSIWRRSEGTPAAWQLLAVAPAAASGVVQVLSQFGLVDSSIFSYLAKLSCNSVSIGLSAASLIWQSNRDSAATLRLLASNNEATPLRNLIKTMAHDLANPIANISAATKSIRRTLGAESNVRSEIGIIERSTTHLMDIIDHVRKLEAIRDGKIAVEQTSVSLLEVFEATHSIFERKLVEKGLDLKFDRTQVANYHVWAEKTTLTHSVINNIVSNSIKFSEKGTTIELAVEATSDEQIRITIHDQGVGIPQNILDVLFSSTSVTSRTGTSGETGTGYGMPLVKAYVDSYGGTIEVKSVTKDEDPVNHGSTFYITLKPGMAGKIVQQAG